MKPKCCQHRHEHRCLQCGDVVACEPDCPEPHYEPTLCALCLRALNAELVSVKAEGE